MNYANENFTRLGLLGEIASGFYESVGTPYALGLKKALEMGDLGAIFNAQIDPSAYGNAYSFALDYACANYLRKLNLPGDKIVLHQEAWTRSLITEKHVEAANLRLSSVTGVEGILLYAKRKIGEILGPFNLQELAASVGWGKGSTSTIKSVDATLDSKITTVPFAVSSSCRPLAQAFLQNALAWNRAALGPEVEGPMCWTSASFDIQEQSKFDTVDKDATKRRGIDIQATFNLFFQKGIGSMIRKRLKKEGIDLDDQSINQRLAQKAQALFLATVDLSEASDTIGSVLVRLLLPGDWEGWMDKTRHKWIRHLTPGGVVEHRLERYSSMGNGFTFELEALVFYALTWAIVRAEGRDLTSPIGIYGDDIIMHARFYPRLEEVFTTVGFKINRRKSYFAGRFYESCGKHFFNGIDVTPVYQKDLITNPSDAIRCANRVTRWALRVGGTEYVHSIAAVPAFLAARAAFLQWDHSRFRKHPMPVQPYWLEGDGGLISFEEFPSNRDGVLRLNLLKNVPNKRQGPLTAAAVLSDDLRKRLVGRVSRDANCALPYKATDWRYQLMFDWTNLQDLFPDCLAVASYGQVVPRDDGQVQLAKRRIYASEKWVPLIDGAWLDYQILIEMQNAIVKRRPIKRVFPKGSTRAKGHLRRG